MIQLLERRRWLLSLLGWAALALLLGVLVHERLGWLVLCGALAVQGLLAMRDLARLEHWLSDPDMHEFPDASPRWQPLFMRLYRLWKGDMQRYQQLSDELSLLREACEALPDGVLLLNTQDHILWCNQTAAVHFSLDPIRDLGNKIQHLLREPAFVRFLHGARDGGPWRWRCKDGQRVLTLQQAHFGENYRVLTSTDITAIDRAETGRREFVANVSHELRTPLTVLHGNLEWLQGDPEPSPEDRRIFHSQMQQQSQRMLGLVNDLLMLAKLENGRSFHDEWLALEPLLERLVADGHSLSQGRHRFVVELPPGIHLRGVSDELYSAIGNLISNAIRYSPAGGDIRIVWSAGVDGRLAVVDQGMGIAPEHWPHLTERFYRVDKSRSRDSGGTGLGLAIVKHVLLRHDARLHIESQPGRGSAFTVVFPPQRWRQER